jgi:hypothetical protein
MGTIFTNEHLHTRAIGWTTMVLLGASILMTTAACAPSGQHQRSSDGGSAAGLLARPGSPDDASDIWPITECGTANGKGCAPTSQRVDLERPTFSDPTTIDNPLFPVSTLHSVIQVGRVDGKPFRSETTTLPEAGVVDWYGTTVPVVLSQYVAYLDGEITEVALDRYAQADDGSVWYFGEDVIDYRDGAAWFTEGTWLAGRDGPPAMVMPPHPELGDVFRVENVLGIVFEELTVVETDKTMSGPDGPVTGAIVVDELGLDGGHSRKTLAPAYGEFLTRGGGELEAVAVSTPANALPGGSPVEIRRLLTAAWGTLEYARAEDWELAEASVRRIDTQLALVDQTQPPPRVERLLHEAARRLGSAVRDRRATAAQLATVDVAQSALDLEARYLEPVVIEVARFHLHSQRLRVEAAIGDAGGVTGEVAALEWLRDRLVDAFDADGLARLDQDLDGLRGAADAGNLASAADQAVRLAADVRNHSAPAPTTSSSG